jgi:hypothetical protein
LRAELSVEFASSSLHYAPYSAFCGGVERLRCKNRPKHLSPPSTLDGYPARSPCSHPNQPHVLMNLTLVRQTILHLCVHALSISQIEPCCIQVGTD